MPNCLLCNSAFPNKIIIDGKLRNLQRRKYCLSCSPFGKHNTTQIHKLDNHHISLTAQTGGVCSWHLCHNKTIGLGKFCGIKCKNKFYVDKRRKTIKLKALEYKGGKCVLCGYNKCVSSLDFHHTEPNAKDFAIAAKGCCRSWEKVKAELDKCILVCRNCHGEIHAGVTEILV
jgi:hypothetical protein